MDEMCPRCGEEMLDQCPGCGNKMCSICGCVTCEEALPAGENEEDQL